MKDLEEHLQFFSESLIQVFKDMFGDVNLNIQSTTEIDHFETSKIVQVNIHFIGRSHGEYILCFDPKVAIDLFEFQKIKYINSSPEEAEFNFISAMSEVLNVTAAKCVLKLDEDHLTNILSPQILWGRRFIPDAVVGQCLIGNEKGTIEAHFYQNDMKVKLYHAYKSIKEKG